MEKIMKTSIAAGGVFVLLFSLVLISQPSTALASKNDDCGDVPALHATQTALPTDPPTLSCPETYIELNVDKPLVEVNELFTLTLIYHNLGLPYTFVSLQPSGLADFDPPISEWPCTYGCSTFTIRAAAVGRLEISAGATGEVYCNGWLWGGGHSKEPAVVHIFEDVWRLHLPVIEN